MFHPVNGSVVTRHCSLILLRKIYLFLNLVKGCNKQFLKFKGFQNCPHFFSGFSGCSVITASVNSSQIKVAKDCWDSCCHLVSISPIFYEQLFCMKVFYAAFMCLQFGFVIFWRKDFDAKAAHKMLVKLPPGGKNWQQIHTKGSQGKHKNYGYYMRFCKKL